MSILHISHFNSNKAGEIIRTDKNNCASGIVSFSYKISDMDKYSVTNELPLGLC